MNKTTDPERSTFQNRPAYRYIRTSDKVPTTDAAHDRDFPIAVIKLFNPTGAGTWFICGYDGETRIAWGAADIHELEVGDFSMDELVAFRGRFGLPIERDLSWTPKPLHAVLAGSR